MTYEITKSVDVAALVRDRDLFKAEVEAGFQRLDKARALYESTKLGGAGTHYRKAFEALAAYQFSSFNARDCANAEKYIKGYDALAWQHLMEQSGLRSFMSSDDLTAWDEGIYAKTTPAFEVANIASTFAKLYADRPAMIRRGVLAIFRSLSWDYKSNLAVKFGRKIVITGRSCMGITTEDARRIDDLIRFMRVSDGLPQLDDRDGFAAKFMFKSATLADGFENDYFSIKGFGNGNLHVIFKRGDLVDEMNRTIAAAFPGALPAPKR